MHSILHVTQDKTHMNRYLVFLVISAFSIISPKLYSQSFTAYGDLLLAFPQGEFEENVSEVGYGLGGGFGYHLGASPLMIGAEIQYIRYGNETRREPFSNTIPDVFVEVETSNNILLFHPLLRLQSTAGAFRPYLDGMIGLSYFFTQTVVRDEDDFDDEEIASSTNQDDSVLSYGFGGGLMIRVYQSEKQNRAGHTKRRELLIDFRVRYLFGGETTYLREGSVTRDNGMVEIDPIRSTTDLMVFQIGVAYMF